MVILPVIVFVMWLRPLQAGEPQDYCQWETFNATCPIGHVILMTSALYGRMRSGRCVQVEYVTNCYSNVMDLADERCSGRRTCAIAIPDAPMYKVQPCRTDLAAYFSAGYDCIPVINPQLEKKKIYCQETIDISNHQNGYIASSVTAETNYGSDNCPYKISASPGQRINVTLLDFSKYNPNNSPTTSPAKYKYSSSRRCPVHAILMESGGGSPSRGAGSSKKIQLCSKNERRRWIHTTTGNNLWIQFINITRETSEQVNFLLHYEVTGCADIPPMAHAKVERNGDSLKIACNFTHEKWHLVCQGTKWIGDYYNCSSDHNTMARGKQEPGEEGFPLGLLIAIAIGVIVGVVLGFVFLITIFVCRKRVRNEGKHDSGNPLMGGGGAVDSDQQNIYRLVEVRPPASVMCDCQYTPGPDHKSIGTIDNSLLMQSSPGECLYRTSPRVEPGECHYQSRDGDIYQQQNIKTCDIISDIHVPEKLSCCEGPDWYTRPQSDTYPRIAPFPGFNRQERGSVPRNNQVPSSHDSGTVADIYEPTTGSSNTSTFQAT